MIYFIIVLFAIIIIEALVIVILSIILANITNKKNQIEISEHNSKIEKRESDINRIKKEHEEINSEIKTSKTVSDFKSCLNKLQDNDNKD